MPPQRYTLKDAKTGEHYTFVWSKKSPPTPDETAQIKAEQFKAKADVAKFQLQDPANQSIFSPSRWASMIPEGITKLGGLEESFLPESAPAPQAGQLMSRDLGEFDPTLGAKPTITPATPGDVAMGGIGKDIYEKAIRPQASPLGIAATVAGGGLGTAAARGLVGPASAKLAAHGISAAMAPGTAESIQEVVANPNLETAQNAALQTGFQMLGGAGQVAAHQVPAVSNIPPPIETSLAKPVQKLLGPGMPEAVELPRPLKAPPKTPKRETIVQNKLKTLEKEALGTGDPKRLQQIMDEVGALEREVEQIQQKPVEKPSEVKVSDKRTVAPVEGELIEKRKAPKYTEDEGISVTDKRAQVDEPKPRELPAQYEGFSREKVIKGRAPDWFEKASKPDDISAIPEIEQPMAKAPKQVSPSKAGKKKLLDKEILENQRVEAAQKGATSFIEKQKKGKVSNIAEKKVQEPGFETIENGYSMKKNPDGSVVLKSPTGQKETYANEGFARARSKRAKKELQQRELEDEPEGAIVTLSDGTKLKKGGVEDYGEGNLLQRYDVEETSSPKVYAKGSTIYHRKGENAVEKFESKLRGENLQKGPLEGPILESPFEERQWRVSKSNPNRVVMTRPMMAKFDKARGNLGVASGTTINYLTKRSIEAIKQFDGPLAAELQKMKEAGKPIEIVSVDKTPEGKSSVGTAIETARHEGTHAEVIKLGGINKLVDMEKFMEHPVAKKLAKAAEARGYLPEQWPDEIMANAMSGGSNRRDITPNMLGDFLRDHVDTIIDNNPEQGYRILKNMNPLVREAVIYGGDEAFTKKTGRGYAEWKRKKSRVETQADMQVEQMRQAGMDEEAIQRRFKAKLYGEFDQRIETVSPKTLEERSKLFDEAREEFALTGKWNKDKVPEGFYNAVNGIKPEGKITPTVTGSPEKGALRLQVIADVPKLAKGAWEEILSSVRNRIQRQGLSGRRFNVKFERMRTNERMIGEEWNTRFDNTVKGLSKTEKDNMVDVIHGIAQPTNNKVATAVAEVRRLDQEVQTRAHVHGIASQDPWATTKDMRAMHEYLVDQAKVIAKNDEFRGPNVLDNLINSAKDPKQMKELVDYLFDNMSYARQSKGLRPYANAAARLEAFSKLTYFVVSNINNMATIPLNTSFKNFAVGLGQALTKEGQKFGRSTGAQWEATRNELFDMGKTGATVSKLNLIPQSEKFQRTVAALSGRAAAKDYFKAFKKNPNNKVARAQLNQLVMEPGGAQNLLSQNALTEHQLKMAGARMAELTHGIAEKFDLPKSWTDNPYAVIPTMFKKYALVGTNNIIRAVRADPVRNIPKLAVLSQIFGEIVGDTKNGLQGAFEGWANDEDIMKKAAERIANRGSWMKGMSWEKDFSLKEKEAIRRVIDNTMQSWFLGMPADIAQSAAMKGESGILEFLAGPHITRLARAGGTLAQKTASKGIEEGVATTVKQQVRESVPLPVRPFLGSAKEDRETELRLKRVRSGRVQMPRTPPISPP